MGLADRIIGAEGKWLMGSFVAKDLLRHLDDHLCVVAPDDADQLVARIKARTGELVEADADLVVDPASEGMLAMAATVLAAYEAIEPRLGADRAILLLRHVFGEVLQRSMSTVIKVLADRDDPLGALDKAMRQSSKMYGSYFVFDFDRPSDERFQMKVSRCFFKDFFERHEARPVTTVLCAWDANWMKAIDTPVTGLRAQRSSLMSLGDPSCDFEVSVTDDPTAAYRDVLDGS